MHVDKFIMDVHTGLASLLPRTAERREAARHAIRQAAWKSEPPALVAEAVLASCS